MHEGERTALTFKDNILSRKKGRFYNRLMSGLQGFMKYGVVFRRHKFSPLIRNKPCFMAITLTSSNESTGKINDAWSVLLKRIRRKWHDFSYIKMRTDEGVSGVLHILAFNSEFITKKWLSNQWGTAYNAPVTWSTQCYGTMKHLGSYLLGYLRHHETFRYGFDRRWMPLQWKEMFRYLFTKKNLTVSFTWVLENWIDFCYSGQHYVYGTHRQQVLV